ncbi:hypothetical protein JAAARDRAFT_648201 [Jaapia argillacea MUCL 33604]|uniref:Secreted protein n=1 Tax=Jaapia argillacea MUCL 33604 TaxID=933084 RepID=A0A067PW79_9AGAM|nr:hypothetical protein JAAARDRAFT_648201 [Jaapia argillacea MUCL 33604]
MISCSTLSVLLLITRLQVDTHCPCLPKALSSRNTIPCGKCLRFLHKINHPVCQIHGRQILVPLAPLHPTPGDILSPTFTREPTILSFLGFSCCNYHPPLFTARSFPIGFH